MDVAVTTTVPEPEPDIARLDRGALTHSAAPGAGHHAVLVVPSPFPSHLDRRVPSDPAAALSRLGTASLAAEALLVAHRTRRGSAERRTP